MSPDTTWGAPGDDRRDGGISRTDGSEAHAPQPRGGTDATCAPGDRHHGHVPMGDGDGRADGHPPVRATETIVPCFTPGTLIATPKGELPVERLKAGDRVITRDNGIREIKWISKRSLSFVELAREHHLRPILIRAGSLGHGLPERDLMLSPNHRVLVANDRTSLYFDEREVLAAAKYLVDCKGIKVVEPLGVTYHHFMCEQHEVVLSNGAWTESFQPGVRSLKGLGNAQRQELFELFPDLQTEQGLNDYAAARRILKKHEAEALLNE